MARKSRHSIQKRQREQRKREKQEAKRLKKAERKTGETLMVGPDGELIEVPADPLLEEEEETEPILDEPTRGPERFVIDSAGRVETIDPTVDATDRPKSVEH